MAVAPVTANSNSTSSRRLLIAHLYAHDRPSIRLAAGGRLSQPGVGHALRQQRHHRVPLGAFHAVPARDLGKRTSAPETEVCPGIDHTDCDARRVFTHDWIVKGISMAVQAPGHPVPALMI